ncbi:MAG TPA: alanine racemase [Caulobacteraceae bacterium]|nr:alanine racemase [Caulobacteraceae bacterium]
MTGPAAAFARSLVGRPGSRWRLPTPALVVDLDAFEANVARMAERARAAGVALRPHAKTHKSAWVAQRQIEAGAVGVCCAKLGEAEALAAAGVADILVTSPVASLEVAERAAALARSGVRLALSVDSPDGVATLGSAAKSAGLVLPVQIDVDVGTHRTGVVTPNDALALAVAIAAAPALGLRGVQGYGGNWQHTKGAENRLESAREGMARLNAVVQTLRGHAHAVEVITGGGTGTNAADRELGVLNELQAGSYIFMDNQYVDALGDDEDGAFASSLLVQAQVISANAPRWVTLDAGLKAFATDGPKPRAVTAPFGPDDYFFFGDEHGGLMRPEGTAIALGQRVELTAPHCDPTVDRYEAFHLVRGDVLEAIVPIEAGRQSQ